MRFPAETQRRGDFENMELMKRVFICGLAIMMTVLIQGCVMICQSKPHSSATGQIQGKVIDALGKPVEGAQVMAIYKRGWTTFYPPVPNGFVAGSTVTDSKGRFLITTKKRVDTLSASSVRRWGALEDVYQQGNCIILKP